MARNIQAPGIELKEFDKSSQKNKPNYSIVGTTVLLNGFADQGENYTTQWINSKQTLINTYGIPTNEPEMYFYNAALEVLNSGGVLLASKLPYKNDSLNSFNKTTYKLSNVKSVSDYEYTDFGPKVIQFLSALDPSLTSYILIENADITSTCKISLNKLDELKTKTCSITPNTITIVDISKTSYQTLPNGHCISSIVKEDICVSDSLSAMVETNDCLGLVPVIVPAVNALYLQNQWDDNLSSLNLTDQMFDVTNQLNVVSDPKLKRLTRNNTNTSENNTKDYTIFFDVNEFNREEHFSIPLSTSIDSNESLSKNATQLFPNIQFLAERTIDKTLLKSVVLVLYKAIPDESNATKIKFEYLEHFVGSLDKNAKDPVTKSSVFIDNVVNQNSRYINVFSNINQTYLNSASTLFAKNLTSYSLGFYNLDQIKVINYKTSIIDGLNIILNRNSNTGLTQIDLVIDAGISNIAQSLQKINTITQENERDYTYRTQVSDSNYPIQLNSASDTKLWYTVIKKYDEFCKYTRRDCMFIADGLKTLCLKGDEKIVRTTDLNSSVTKSILPKLRYISNINSSYTAGYCNWFRSIDDYSSDFFWCPPSIKVVGVYLYIDTYFKTWDAPAGISRAVINGVVDTAFTPNNYEAGQLYSQCWNYAINYPVQGIVLEGQKTMQLQKTAFDRINVRRLFLYIEKRVIELSKYFLYEHNTEEVRQRFVDLIRPVLEYAVTGYGINEYFIKCDSSNNTTETINNNELHCSIAIKPVKTIEFIVLDFVCTNQGASVEEEIM